EAAFAVLDQCSRDYFAIWLSQIQRDAAKLCLTVCVIQAEKTSVSAGPELLFAVFIQDVHVIGGQLIAHPIRREQIADLRSLIRQWRGVEPSHPAALGRYPVDSAPGLEQIVDERMGQPLFYSIVGELVAVEAAQTVTGAEPKKVVRIANNAQDKVARQAIGGCVDTHRKLFRGDRWQGKKKQKYQARDCDRLCPVDDLK